MMFFIQWGGDVLGSDQIDFASQYGRVSSNVFAMGNKNKNRRKTVKPKKSLLPDPHMSTVLLSLRRQYSESEAVKLIEEENSFLRVEHGKMVSYCAELEERLRLFEEMSPSELSQWKNQKMVDVELSQLKKDLEKTQQEKNHWKKIYLALLPKTHTTALPT